ncbi:MAG: transporter substrate-binding protein [Rhizobacter sp.]|nr:transporter substrate-binding protein [Rhizobacter sp.]
MARPTLDPSTTAVTAPERRTALKTASALAAAALWPRLSQAQETPRRGGVLVAQTYSDLRALNPAIRTSYAIHVFTSKMVEPLVDLDAAGQPAARLATAWESSPDGKTITFKLRQGVAWHDGKPFTSADVQFCAMEMWKKYQNFGTQLHKNLTAVDTPDAHTAVFRYSTPMPLGLLLRAFAELGQVVPRHLYEGTDILANPANNAPVGTGPFKFVSYVPGEHLTMERNPTYWMAGFPYLDRLIIRVIPDGPATVAALESGDIQMSLFSSLPRTENVRLAKDSRFRVSSKGNEANPLFNTIGFNTRRKELADVRVRQAFAHAVDWAGYAKNFDYGYSKPAQGPWPTTSPFFTPGVPTYAYDLKKAEALLDQAGYPRGADGVRFRMRIMPNQSDSIRQLAVYIQQSMQKVGVRLDNQLLDAPGYLKAVNKDWDFEICTDTGTFRGDPAVGSTIWYHSGIPAGVPWSNQFGWKSDEIDTVADQAAVELDPAKRKALYQRFAVIANTEMPVLMALEANMVSAVNAKVRNDHNMPRWPASSWHDVWIAA